MNHIYPNILKRKSLSADGRPGAMVVQLGLFCIGSIALYFPILGRTFASDDFQVIKRVGMDRTIWIKGFFRPLSDIKLYCNYILGGNDPWGYYFSNIVLHGGAAFLFYRFCRAWKWTRDEDRQGAYALLAALLFLCYPFHNECVAWVLGGGVLLANLLGIAAMYAVVSGLREGWRIFWCCLCYFMGMAGYESVMLLPLMVLVLLYSRETGWRRYFRWGLALGMTFAIHLAVRILVAGGLANDYGNAFFKNGAASYLGNLFKVAGRLMLPPMKDSWMLVGSFILVMAALGWLVHRRWRRWGSEERAHFLKLLLLLGIASAVAVLSGVSTHTSESDRFLYFPSCFLCAGIAFLLFGLKEWFMQMTLAAILLSYEIVFLEVNNRNWVKASRVTREVLTAVEASMDGRRDAMRKVFVVNLPDDLNGAFIFRLGLPDALLMEGRDTSGLVIVGHLSTKDVAVLPVVERSGADSFHIAGSGDPQTQPGWERGRRYVWGGGKGDVVLYWNGRRMEEWSVLHLF